MAAPVMALGLAVKGAKMLAKKRGAKAASARGRGGRRRRVGLTAKRKSDLLWLRNNVGKTAAANYLANHSL